MSYLEPSPNTAMYPAYYSCRHSIIFLIISLFPPLAGLFLLAMQGSCIEQCPVTHQSIGGECMQCEGPCPKGMTDVQCLWVWLVYSNSGHGWCKVLLCMSCVQYWWVWPVYHAGGCVDGIKYFHS